jgi:hypothetical protein
MAIHCHACTGCEFSISGLIKPLQSIASTLGGVLAEFE